MFWMILAAQLSVPVPVNRPFFSDGDIPATVRNTGVPREVYVRLTIRPNGLVESCAVELTSGDLDIDAHSCELLAGRSQFHGAKWIDGSPVYGVVRTNVTWAMSDDIPNDSRIPDLDLTVNQLPEGTRSPVGVLVQIAVGSDGHPEACGDLPPHALPVMRKNLPELVSVACSALMSNFIATPAKDEIGKAVPSVQTAYVQFRTDH
jgi:hypothetical protein